MSSTAPSTRAQTRRGHRRGLVAAPEQLPPYSPLVVRWFVAYSRRYLRRHFHSLRVSCENFPGPACGDPPVIYVNHASWWDPLVLLLLTHQLYPGRKFFAPMDAKALERYGFFRRIGCFGVELGSLRGAKQFLGASLAALGLPDGGLCVTPQGRFADVRERPVRFESGLGQLALRAPEAVFVPLALEYVFWEERSPEILARFGEPIIGRELQSCCRDGTGRECSTGGNPAVCTRFLEDRLRSTQDALAVDSLSRDPVRFRNLLHGSGGVGGVYDRWRQMRCWIRGERFVPEHSSL